MSGQISSAIGGAIGDVIGGAINGAEKVLSGSKLQILALI